MELGYIGDDAGILDGSVGMSGWSWDAYMVIVKCLRELLSKSVLRVWTWKWTGGVTEDGSPALSTVLGKPPPESEQSFGAS